MGLGCRAPEREAPQGWDGCPGAWDSHEQIVAVASGSAQTCVTTGSGRVRCWGTWAPGSTPESDEPAGCQGFVPLQDRIEDIALGSNVALAVTSRASLLGWGTIGGNTGLLGPEAAACAADPACGGDDDSPQVFEVDPGFAVDSVAITLATPEDMGVIWTQRACATSTDGKLRCWNSPAGHPGGLSGLLGDDESIGSLGDIVIGEPVTRVAPGLSHACALTRTGAVRCLGCGPAIGHPTGSAACEAADELCPSCAVGLVGHPENAAPVSIPTPVVDLTAGDTHTCALVEDGSVYCWGFGNAGVLGYGNEEDIGDDEVPEDSGPVPLLAPATAISAGAYHTCALLDDASVQCWGVGEDGQLGYGATENIGDDDLATDWGRVDVGLGVARVSAGAFHTCVLTVDSTVRCWGRGKHGALGYGSDDAVGDDEAPAEIGDVPVFPPRG